MGLGSSSSGDMEVDLDKIRVVVKGLIDCDKIVIFSKTTCPYCRTAKSVSVVVSILMSYVENSERFLIIFLTGNGVKYIHVSH
jgi:hypothetical protein